MAEENKINIDWIRKNQLLSLIALSRESARENATVKDVMAEEILNKIDCDQKLNKKVERRILSRIIMLDKMTEIYLKKYPGAIVINLACGLDTRCHRVKGYSRWYNIDSPTSMGIREKLLDERGPVYQIADSVISEYWTDKIAYMNEPVLVILEDFSMYHTEAETVKIFKLLDGKFKKSTVLIETMTESAISHDEDNLGLVWGIKNGKMLEEKLEGFKFVAEHSMAELGKNYRFIRHVPFMGESSNSITILKNVKAVKAN